jgi:hypothetical protein
MAASIPCPGQNRFHHTHEAQNIWIEDNIAELAKP